MRISGEPATARPVEVVVGVHHGGHVSLMNGGAERHCVDVAELALPDGDLSVVEASEGTGVPDEVLSAAVDALALHAPDVGHPHTAHEFGILAVCFFEAAPPGVAGDVEDGGEGQAAAHGPHLPSDHPRNLLHQTGIPRRRQTDRLGKARCSWPHETRERLLVGERRDTETGPLLEEALDPVYCFSGWHRVEPGASDACDLSEPVGEVVLHEPVVELSVYEKG